MVLSRVNLESPLNLEKEGKHHWFYIGVFPLYISGMGPKNSSDFIKVYSHCNFGKSPLIWKKGENDFFVCELQFNIQILAI